MTNFVTNMLIGKSPAIAMAFSLLSVGTAFAIDSLNAPRPIPLTRPEMKEPHYSFDDVLRSLHTL